MRQDHRRAFSLIEATIFMVLLSILMTGLMTYLRSIYDSQTRLLDDVDASYDGSAGFIASTAVIIISLGICAMMLSGASAVFWYADSVDAREIRIQHELNAQACRDTIMLIEAKKLTTQGSGSEFSSELCLSLGFPL